MATTKQVSLTTTPTLITSTDGAPRTVLLHTTAITYIGGDSSVSSSNGFRMDANDKIPFTIIDGSSIYAVAASGTQTMYVWEQIL